MKIIGAVDIGGTKIAVGAARQDGEIIFRAECPTRAESGFAAAMDRIKAMLREAATRLQLASASSTAFGFRAITVR